MFQIIDKPSYNKFKNIILTSAYPTSNDSGQIKDNLFFTSKEWQCETCSEEYIYVRCMGGVLSVSYSERLYDLKSNMKVIAKDEKLNNVKFKDIAEFMEWEIDEEKYLG